jgi:hypothetical protein
MPPEALRLPEELARLDARLGLWHPGTGRAPGNPR